MPAMSATEAARIRFSRSRAANPVWEWVAECSACGQRFYSLPGHGQTAINTQLGRHRDEHRFGLVRRPG